MSKAIAQDASNNVMAAREIAPVAAAGERNGVLAGLGSSSQRAAGERNDAAARVKPGFKASAAHRLFQRFKGYIARERSPITHAALFMIGVAVMEVLKPWPLKIVFDGMIIATPPKDGVTLWATELFGRGDLLLGMSAAAILAIAILGGVFGYAQTVLLAGVGRRVVTSIRFDLYRHIQCLSQSFHDTASAGDLLARLTGDVRLLRDLLVTSVIYMFGRALVLVGTIAVMALMNVQLTLIAITILPILMTSSWLFSRRIKQAARRQRKNESRVTHVMAENLESIRVIQAHAREAYENDRFQRENITSAEGELATTRLEASMDRVVEIVLAVGTCAVLWFGVAMVRSGELSPGDLLVFTAYLAGMYKPIRKLASLTGRFAKATACGERVLSLLEIEPEIVDRPGARDSRDLRGDIELRNVSFGYGGGNEVLKDADVMIAAGQTVAFASASGSGKSTIAHLLLRFYEPTSGSILIDGTDLRDYKLSALRESVTVLQQEPVLFNASIRDNIAYGRADATGEEIERAARAARAHGFISALPNGYETILGRRGITLSGGQRQRIAIARAMIRKSPVVVLDEPGTGLDAANERAVMEAVRELAHNRTCILITHSPHVTDMADRVFDVNDGQIRERGTRPAGHAPAERFDEQ